MSFNPNQPERRIPGIPDLSQRTQPQNQNGNPTEPNITNALPKLPKFPGSLPDLPKAPTSFPQVPAPTPRIPRTPEPVYEEETPDPSYPLTQRQQLPRQQVQQDEEQEPDRYDRYNQPPVQNNLRAKRPAPQWEPEEEPTKKGFFSPRPPKNPKKSSSRQNKKTAFSGRRRNVIIARILVFGLAGALMIAGVLSFLPKSSGLTASDKPLIISAVRENLNFTDFPRTTGEGFASAFASAYLNYNPETIKERTELLTNFVDPDILPKIDTRPASAEEIATANTNNPTSGTAVPAPPGTITTQTVTDGPYVVGTLMYKGGNAAMYTIMAEINNSNWIFMQIPMYYDKNTGGLSVSGSLTFSPPIVSTTVPEWENSVPWQESDQEVENKISSDLSEYIKAWAASDQTNIDRFLVKKDGKILATRSAQQGLNSTVKVISVDKLNVESKPPLPDGATAEEQDNFNTRQANVTVTFLEPTSNMVYKQDYRLVLKYVNQDWFIQDINNTSTLVDRNETISKEQEKAADK